MRTHVALWIGIGAMLLVLSQFWGLWSERSSAGAAVIEAQRHFRALLPPQPIDIIHIIQTAQRLDYWIRIQTGADVTYLKGLMPCSACDPSQESSFFVPPQLHVDGQNFWIRLDETNWQLNLRPARGAPSSYELIVSPKLPKTEINTQDLSEISMELGPFGILSAQTQSLSLEPLIVPTKPEPPEGVRIDSVLYGLTLAPDWKRYAAENEIELSGLRARVLIELHSATADLPEELNLVIEARTDRLLRAQVLVHRLEELARHPAVEFVRLPSRPQPPAL